MRITKMKNTHAPSVCGRRTFLMGAAAALGLWCVRPLTVVAGGTPHDNMQALRRVVPLMGTWVQVEIRHAHQEVLEAAMEAAFAEANLLEALLTRHDAAAPLGQLHASGFLKDAPPPLCTVVQAAMHAAASTAPSYGGFNPAIGFNPAVAPALEALEASGQADIHALPAHVRRDLGRLCSPAGITLGKGSIRLDSAEMRLTLDGIAKGHVVDAMARVLERHGVAHYLVNAGGDMLARGQQAPGNPWLVGIQHGVRADTLVRTIALEGALASSGNGERLAKGLAPHILSAGGVVSVSVWAASAIQADALATALYSLPLADGQRLVRGNPLGHVSSLWQLTDSSVV